MEIHARNGGSVKINVWKHKDGDGEFRPLQTYDPIEHFAITINDEKITVYFNKSKSSVEYYYLKINGLWHWTRDGKIKINNHYTS